MAKKNNKELTAKEEKFVQTLASNGGNGTKAALEAYDTENYDRASAIASKKMKSPKIQEALKKELAKQGITLPKALKPIARALADKDLEMQLKGSDRALKLLLPNRGENNLSVNLNIDSAHFGGEFVIDGEEEV